MIREDSLKKASVLAFFIFMIALFVGYKAGIFDHAPATPVDVTAAPDDSSVIPETDKAFSADSTAIAETPNRSVNRIIEKTKKEAEKERAVDPPSNDQKTPYPDDPKYLSSSKSMLIMDKKIIMNLDSFFKITKKAASLRDSLNHDSADFR